MATTAVAPPRLGGRRYISAAALGGRLPVPGFGLLVSGIGCRSFLAR